MPYPPPPIVQNQAPLLELGGPTAWPHIIFHNTNNTHAAQGSLVWAVSTHPPKGPPAASAPHTRPATPSHICHALLIGVSSLFALGLEPQTAGSMPMCARACVVRYSELPAACSPSSSALHPVPLRPQPTCTPPTHQHKSFDQPMWNRGKTRPPLSPSAPCTSRQTPPHVGHALLDEGSSLCSGGAIFK